VIGRILAAPDRRLALLAPTACTKLAPPKTGMSCNVQPENRGQMTHYPSGLRGITELSTAERALIEKGPLSKDELCNLAVEEGYFPDFQNAAQSIGATLGEIVERKHVCTLPDGTFALPMLSPAVKLKLVV
jgi:hypothetical protein